MAEDLLRSVDNLKIARSVSTVCDGAGPDQIAVPGPGDIGDARGPGVELRHGAQVLKPHTSRETDAAVHKKAAAEELVASRGQLKQQRRIGSEIKAALPLAPAQDADGFSGGVELRDVKDGHVKAVVQQGEELLQRAGRKTVVTVEKEQPVAPGVFQAHIARSAQTAVFCGDDTDPVGKAPRIFRGKRGGIVGRPVVDDEDLVIAQLRHDDRVETGCQIIPCVIDRDHNTQFHIQHLIFPAMITQTGRNMQAGAICRKQLRRGMI